MSADALSAPKLPVTPQVLRWARLWRGRSVAETSQKLKVLETDIQAWERGDGAPSVKQARQLADFYNRSFLEFFLAEPPDLQESLLVPDFRLHRDGDDPRESREIKLIQSWAEEQRNNALSLYDLVGDKPIKFPDDLTGDLDRSPEPFAERARELGGFTVTDQVELKSTERDALPKLIRRAIERMGVLVLRQSSLSKLGVRGLCIFDVPLPTIVFGGEAPAAQAFTLAHELGHVVLQQSAISGPPRATQGASTRERVEAWCNRFAAAYLVPKSAMANYWTTPNAPVSELGDDTLSRLAADFRVSRHAMLIRLVHLGYVAAPYYWDVKLPQFLQEERDYKGGGRAKYYGTRYSGSRGDLYTGLVLEAWANGAINNHNAAEFMGIKNLTHLDDIRTHFGAP